MHLAAGLPVLATGALEAWFGRPELFGDDISYLDVVNSIHADAWKAALNPLWSIGYPALLVFVRPWFAAGMRGELTAVFVLNLSIDLAAWLSFLWILYNAAAFLRAKLPHSDAEVTPVTLLAAACVFACVQVGFGRVSSVGPDLLVCCLFFLASGFALRFTLHPSVREGVMLGVTLGLGFLAKAIFLPLSVILLATALLPRRGLRPAIALAAPVMLLCLMIPYAAALSWALGHPTLGESGALNYAFHVNQLPHWMGWQGGPPKLGYPVHPVRLLRTHPAVFVFGEPFHVTYPPQFNLHHWYDGYRHFFYLPNAIRAILTNLHALEAVLHENWPITLSLLLSAAIMWVPHGRRAFVPTMGLLPRVWPVYLPSIFGILLYLQVHLEGRYITAFVAILAVLPFVLAASLSPRLRAAVAVMLLAGASLDLAIHLRVPLRLAIHHADMQSSGQWTVAAALKQFGLKPGDPVASVTTGNDIRCTWAYAAHLRIVADIGNDAFDPASQQQDFRLFWSDPVIQQDVLRLFRAQGAVAVIAPEVDPTLRPTDPAWRPIPNTQAWFLPLQ